MNLTDWYEPDPAWVISPADDQEWDEALARYRGSTNDGPFNRCIEIARAHGAKHVLIETRFPDVDYRSEHHALYARVFTDVHAYTHRLHFFAGDIGPDMTALPDGHGYIGYVIVRPVTTGVVSRAMLPPPPGGPVSQCAVRETIHLFGQSLTVRGMPFTQQDSRLGACAHAAAWMCHYTAVLRGDVGRRARADFALEADQSLGIGRAVPTKGLTIFQIADLMRRFGLPAEFHFMGNLPTSALPWVRHEPQPPKDDPNADPGTWDSRVFAVLCWYLNGGYPVIVGTKDHAFVIVGWSRDPDNPGRIQFTRHDDQQGPYLTVENPLDDKVTNPVRYDYGPWQTLQVPLPPDLWLEPDAAERTGGIALRGASAKVAGILAARGEDVEDLDTLIDQHRLAMRTYPILSETFKAVLPNLGMDPVHVSEYRQLRLPRHVWVVEAVDRAKRAAGEPCVVGEMILDATSAQFSPEMLATRVHGVLAKVGASRSVRGSRALTRMGGAVS